MAAIKHLTLGPGWGGYTVSPDTRAVVPVGPEEAVEDDNRVYEALLKRLREETANVARLNQAEAAPDKTNASVNEPSPR